MRGCPLIYEVNAWVWLERWRSARGALDHKLGRRLDLGNLPDEAVDQLVQLGLRAQGARPDAVWLMGVWERSPAARALARSHHEVRAECEEALPGLTDRDIAGSPYSVRRYTVDPELGGDAGLDALRARLRQRGVGLLLDLVPNHVALDSPWLIEHPEAFVRGTEARLAADPGAFFRHPETGEIFAHGRDPYFAPWTDTVQVDALSPSYRRLLAQTLLDLVGRCDGVRCDMAMLLVRRVFEKTWAGARRDGTLDTELWPEVIAAAKRQREAQSPFVFLAEVYWDMEAELQAQGFDLTYDKRLYDRLLGRRAGAVRDHLLARAEYQARSLRFIENHDEPRAATSLAGAVGRAAAVLTLSLPGARLVHQGQEEGLRIKLPVQLGRAPDEAPDPGVSAFYARLLTALAHPAFHDGSYLALGVRPLYGEAEEPAHSGLIAHAWILDGAMRIVVVNYSDRPARARLMLPPLPRGLYRFRDALDDAIAPQRSAEELSIEGLPVLLDPYGTHLFAVEAAPSSAA